MNDERIRTNPETGRILIILDGYSLGYHAYVSGALTGRVSLPATYAGESEDRLFDLAKLALQSKEDADRIGAKIVRAAGRVF